MGGDYDTRNYTGPDDDDDDSHDEDLRPHELEEQFDDVEDWDEEDELEEESYYESDDEEDEEPELLGVAHDFDNFSFGASSSSAEPTEDESSADSATSRAGCIRNTRSLSPSTISPPTSGGSGSRSGSPCGSSVS